MKPIESSNHFAPLWSEGGRISRSLVGMVLSGAVLSGACASESVGIPAEDYSIREWLREVELNILPSDESTFENPSPGERGGFRVALQALLDGDELTAKDLFSSVDYELARIRDPHRERTYLALRESPDGIARGWGSLILNDSPKQPRMHIQVPHPMYDLETLEMSRIYFHHSGARSMLVAGSHRYNFSVEEGGVDSASDVAHNQDTVFQVASEVLASAEDSLTVQLHGFAQRNHPEFPEDSAVDVIVGDGHKNLKSESAKSIADRLDEADFEVRRCGLNWDSLCGTTNVQGSAINRGEGEFGEFVHIEISDGVRREFYRINRFIPQLLPKQMLR